MSFEQTARRRLLNEGKAAEITGFIACCSELSRNFGALTFVILLPAVAFPHTHFTYHRTWETGLRVAIRVTAFSPAFFCPPQT
jgi:hypothetical protein